MDSEFIYEKMKLYSKDIKTVGFSQYVIDCLYWRGYTTVGKIAESSAKELRSIGGIGNKYFTEIVEKMAELGIDIHEEPVRHYDSARKYPYPNNLVAAVYGTKADELENEYYSTDRLRGIAAALSMLTEQEETMVLLRFKHYATFEEIGGYYGLTRERARQIIKKALRKLRHPSRSILFHNGIDAYIDSKADERAEEKARGLLFDEYVRGYNAGFEDAEKGGTNYVSSYHSHHLNMEDLDLSVRSFNCLKRAGINTLEDIINITNPDAIMRIRNLGRKSAVEIAEKLLRLGICNEAWASILTGSSKPGKRLEDYGDVLLEDDIIVEIEPDNSDDDDDDFDFDGILEAFGILDEDSDDDEEFIWET